MRILICFFTFLTFSCSSAPEYNTVSTAPGAQREPVIPFATLTAEFDTWWQYHYNAVDLTTDFLPLDTEGTLMEKSDFLKALVSGNFITIEMKGDVSGACYQLFAISAPDKPQISAVLKSVAKLDLKRYQMEGRSFPEFELKDLSGQVYNLEQLRGKYTVVKTWFIACKPCITEFPELNELVASYSDRHDIQFLSLALDDAAALEFFLKKKPFNYYVAADQRTLIQKDLHLATYPTHLVVGPEGKILKVVGKVQQLEAFLASI